MCSPPGARRPQQQGPGTLPGMASEGRQSTVARGSISQRAASSRRRDHGGGTGSEWLAARGRDLAGYLGSPQPWRSTLKRVVFGSLAFTSTAAMLYLYWRSWWVLANHHFQPCDVPLARILCSLLLLAPIFLGRFCICRTLHRACGWSGEYLCQALILGLACFCLAYYTTVKGMRLVYEAETCQTTSPWLYDWAAYIFPKGVLHFVALRAAAACSGTVCAQAASGTDQGPEGLDHAAFAAMGTVQPDSGSSCSICLEGYAEGVAAKAMPCCSNYFHAECLQGWMASHRTCPICRTELQCTRRGCT